MSDKMPLTFGDVHKQVVDLLDTNGRTTTLEIKLALRNIGFNATQSEVAQSMYTLWPLYDWHWTFNGTYRTYFPNLQEAINDFATTETPVHQTSWLGWLVSPFDSQIVPPQSTSQPVSQPVTPPIDKGELVDGTPEETQNPAEGDWMAFSYSNSEPPAFITGVTLVTGNGNTREQARMAVRNVVRNYYSQLAQVPYSDVGANIVKV
jgi:hypothetical protein